MFVLLPAHRWVSNREREGQQPAALTYSGVQQSLEPLTPEAGSERFQGDREASSQGMGRRGEDRGGRQTAEVCGGLCSALPIRVRAWPSVQWELWQRYTWR